MFIMSFSHLLFYTVRARKLFYLASIKKGNKSLTSQYVASFAFPPWSQWRKHAWSRERSASACVNMCVCRSLNSSTFLHVIGYKKESVIDAFYHLQSGEWSILPFFLPLQLLCSPYFLPDLSNWVDDLV